MTAKPLFYAFLIYLFCLISCKIDSKANVESALVEENDTIDLAKNTSIVDTLAKMKADTFALEAKKDSLPKQTPESKIPTTQTKKPTQVVQENKAKGKMVFESNVHDYGYIEEGTQIDYDFTFVNKGNAPINISKVEASCGCTRPTYSFLAIEPEKTSKIQVHFNSSGRLGPQESTITVYSDAEKAKIMLTLKGIVTTSIEK